jgi:queuine tRNA-ribosyltransferase
MAREMLGPILLSIHNLTFYQRLLAGARSAIERGEFASFRERKLSLWRSAAAARSTEG